MPKVLRTVSIFVVDLSYYGAIAPAPKVLRTVCIFVVSVSFYATRPPMPKVLRTVFLSPIYRFMEPEHQCQKS